MQNEKDKEFQSKLKVVNIATMVRIRPLLQSQADLKESITCKDQVIIHLFKKCIEINLSGQIRKENLEKVFSPKSTQRQVFESIQPILGKCIAGFNVTIFTYGQTGSGKTHTMFGSDWNNIIRKPSNQQSAQTKQAPQQTFLRSIQQDQNHSGLIPRTIHHLFNNLVVKRRKYIKVYCSFLQLYNQSMLDLLEDDFKTAKQKKMFIHENQKDGIYIQGLNQILVDDADQCLELMKKGQKNRMRMKLNLCDLAGSEKINKSEKMQSQHFQQLKNINLSLTTLGKVISSLSQRTKSPYRQSKLTRLLQDSLGGNTYTAIIATITTKSSCLDESLNTLKFLQRAKQIKSEIISKLQMNDNPEMNKLQKQIAYLKDILKMKRNGTSVIDVDLTEKYKKLQQENSKLKELVDQQLVEKLKKQNMQLKNKLEKKSNDQISESFLKSGQTFAYRKSQNNERMESQANYRTKQHKTIEQSGSGSGGDLVSNKDDINSQYRFSSQNIARSKNVLSKNMTYGRSTDGSSISNDTKTNNSKFPSLVKKSTTYSTNKILDRIQQIQKVKHINKLKLQKQLENMNNNKISLQSKSTFARVSKYSTKYRY